MAKVHGYTAGWEQTWREAIRTEALHIIEEEAGAAADKVHQRIQELGAKLAVQLSRMAEVQTMGERITIAISTKGLEPLLRQETADAKVARLEDELDVALEEQARSQADPVPDHECGGGPCCSVCGDKG